MDRSKSRMDGIEEQISELKASKIEVTQSKQQRENRLGKIMNRASGTCGTTTNNLTFVSLDSWEEKKDNNEKVLDFLKTKTTSPYPV